jgi:prolyl oligopeptidase
MPARRRPVGKAYDARAPARPQNREPPHVQEKSPMNAFRLLSAGALAALALAAAPAVAGPITPPAPQPFTETVHGQTLSDEYRWMEDPARAEDVNAWIRAESAATQQALAGSPLHAEFAASIKAVAGQLTRVFSVQQAAGGRVAFQRIGAEDRVPRLVVRQGGREHVLIDPNTQAGQAGASVVAVNNHAWSPDGRRIAVHTAQGGGEVGQIVIHDAATGQPVGEPIGPVWGEFRLVWLDNATIAATLMAPVGAHADPMQGMTLQMRRLETAAGWKPLYGPQTQPFATAPKDFPMLLAPPTSPWVAALAAGARVDLEVLVAQRRELASAEPQVPWRRAAALADRVRSVALRGDDLFLLSTKDNPYGRVTRQRLAPAGPGPAATLAEGRADLLIEAIESTRDGLYLRALTDGRSRLFFSRGGTRPLQEVRLPIEGTIVDFEASADGRSLSFGLMGWFSNTRYFSASGTRLSALGLASDSWPGAAQFKATRLSARSADGTAVPLVALHKPGAPPAGGYPALLTAYGSYGESMTSPYYERMAMAWIDRGGVIAYCGTRGGGERGRPWHDGGRERHKPRAQEDLVACAEKLKAEGLARAVGPVVAGTSAGGLLAPPAALKHPGAFSGLVARVAVSNASRLGQAPNGANQFDEMGDPNTPEGFAALLAQDAYHLSATATDLPDTLLTVGLNDKRVAPWMSAKFAARAKARFGDRRSILLRADTDAGHGVGSAEASRQAERADIFTFAWQRASR